MITKIKFVLLIVISFLATSCNDPNVTFVDVLADNWTWEDSIAFDRVDSPKKIYFRHTDDYAFQNIWVKISMHPKGEDPIFKRYEFQIARPDGSWLGDRSGALYTIGYDLPNFECIADTCELVIIQNMRVNPLGGMQSIGLGE